jgi:phytochrome A
MLAQTTVDAELGTKYEDCHNSFGNPMLLEGTTSNNLHQGRSEKDIAYLQPFGCLLVLDAKSLNVIAFSENAPEMLSTVSHAESSIYESPMLSIGTNVLSLFVEYSATSLYMVLRSADVSSLNPVLVECRSSGKLFYAIAHQVTETDCLMVDFERVKPSEFSTAAAWDLPQSYMLAAPAVSKIQSVPGGSMEVLCHTLVQEIFDLVGYDRVMAYKFHEDYHGEIIAEVRKPGLEPFIGLHYPATDIPQAARILFMKHQVQMICDFSLRPVKIIKDEELPFNVSLCGSTLGVPHSCHLQYMKNMKSVASLVMAVSISENGEYSEAKHEQPTQWRHPRKKLWGLIVCQHMSPRYVPFSLRHACEFIAQVFAVHINKELELEKQMRHRSMIKRLKVLFICFY